MLNAFSRTSLIVGDEGIKKLSASRVIIFGLGGVGGYVCEALARCGVGYMELVDDDVVSLTNINRQILALNSTIGRYKAEVAAERVRDIDPNITVVPREVFFTPETAVGFDFSKYDYVVDAIDTVTGKLAIVEKAIKAGVPVISCMGAGNKLDPTAFEVADISETSVCPLARVMRRELKKRGIERGVKVVYSREEPIKPNKAENEEESAKRSVAGSISFVPSVAGLIAASEVIKDLLKKV